MNAAERAGGPTNRREEAAAWEDPGHQKTGRMGPDKVNGGGDQKMEVVLEVRGVPAGKEPVTRR